jgi:tripartite-type tricarboxylate transporter receptor subunit TctC
VLAAGLGCAAYAVAGPVFAQAAPFPSKTLRIVVNFPPGGSSDGVARILAEKLSADWGSAVIVENKPGAGGTIATALVAAAPADGYTLLLIGPGTHAIASALYTKLPYDPIKSFTSVSQVGVSTYFVLVNASSKVATMKELIDNARANPGGLSYASTGNGSGSHLVSESIALATGTKFLHAPFAGAAPATLALLSEQVNFAISDVSAVPHLQSGKLRALAVTSNVRFPQLPNIPTIAEAGLPEVMYVLSVGLVGPARIPRDVVTKINTSVERVINDENSKKRLAALGFDARSSTPEEYGNVIANDVVKFARLVKQVGLKSE